MSRCIITGCELVIYGGKWCHGDLHEVDGAFVFNACLQLDGSTNWQYGNFPGEDRLVLRVDGDYFERRGVIVVAKADALLNARAAKYVATPVAWIDSVLGSRSGDRPADQCDEECSEKHVLVSDLGELAKHFEGADDSVDYCGKQVPSSKNSNRNS